jgi:hypothetical protein
LHPVSSDASLSRDSSSYGPGSDVSLPGSFEVSDKAASRAAEFVQVEDLVLHDGGMDARSPTHELVCAHAVLLARQRIATRQPNWALTPSGPGILRGSWSIRNACANEKEPASQIWTVA